MSANLVFTWLRDPRFSDADPDATVQVASLVPVEVLEDAPARSAGPTDELWLGVPRLHRRLRARELQRFEVAPFAVDEREISQSRVATTRTIPAFNELQDAMPTSAFVWTLSLSAVHIRASRRSSCTSSARQAIASNRREGRCRTRPRPIPWTV